MILAPANNARYSEIKSFEQANNLHSMTDYGAWKGMQAAFSNGFHNNMTMTLSNWIIKNSLNGVGDLVTEEDYNNSHAPRLGLEFNSTETMPQLEHRIHQAAIGALNNEYMSGQNRTIRNVGSGFAGGMLTDPLALAPITLPSKGAKLSRLHQLAGNRVAASYHQAASTFKNVLAVNAAYEVPYALMMNDLGVQEYTLDHLKMSVGFNVGAAGLFGGIHGYSAFKNAGRSNHIVNQMDLFNRAFEADDQRTALSTALDSENFVIKRLFEENPELRDWAEGRSTTPITREQFEKAKGILFMHQKHLEARALSVKAARKLADRAKKSSVSKLLGVQRRQAARLTELVLNGLNAERITPRDAALLKENGYVITDFTQVHPRIKSIVPGVGFIPDAAKVYGDKLYELVNDALEAQQDFLDPDILPVQKQLNQEVFDKKVAEINQMVGENFGLILQDAQKVVDQIFFGKEGVITVKQVSETSLDPKKREQVYAYILGNKKELVTYMNEPFFVFSRIIREDFNLRKRDAKGKLVALSEAQLRTMFDEAGVANTRDERAFVAVFRLLMHEMVHHLEEIDTDAYLRLYQAAANASGSRIKALRTAKGLIREGRERGYSIREVLSSEIPAFVVEYAVTQPEFWNTLKNTDPDLYNKMAEMMNFLAKNLYETVGRYNNTKINAVIKKTQDGGKLASEISRVLTEIRNSSTTQAKLKDAIDNAKFTSSLERFMDADDAQLNALEVNDQRTFSLLETNAKDQDYRMSDPVGFFDRAVADLLGGDETAMSSLLQLSVIPAKEMRAAIATYVESMQEKGHTWMTQDLADDIVITLQASRKRGRDISKIVLSSKDFASIRDKLAGLADRGLPLEAAQRIGYILLDETGGSAKQISRITRFLEEESHAQILRKIHDAITVEALTNTINSQKSGQARVDQLKTFMDGSRRKTVTIGPSLQSYKTVQKQLDQNPLLDYLVENDLLNIFFGEDPSHYMSSYVNNTIGNKDLAALYGRELKQASILMHRDIMTALSTGELPKQWQGVKVWEGLIDVIRKTNKSQLGQMNRLGLSIRDREGFLGYSMTYDRAYVKSMGFDAFQARMLEMIDMRATAKAHGGLMAERPDAKTSKLKDAGRHKKFNKNTFLRGLYNEIVEGDFVKDPDQTNPSMLGGYRKAAKVVFKPEHRIDALIEFGNRKNMGRFMFEQIAQRSESIALVRHVGHDANGILTGLIDPRATVASRLTAKGTIDQVTGLLDTPIDANLNSIFKNVRQVQNIAMLGGAGFSSLSDIPLVWSTLQFLGVGSEGMGAYFSRYQDAISTQFGGNKKKMAQWFRAQGAAFDLVTRSMAQRVVTDDSGVGGKINTANDFMFEINFLNRLTAAHQQLFIDMLTSGLATELSKGKNMNPVTRERLNEFGFTNREITQLAKSIEKTPDGIERIGPSTVKNASLQKKLSAFMNQYMREGVIEPDVGAQAMSRLGLQAGTMGGETARLALQYSSFMIAMGRVVYRRFLYGYNGDKKGAAFRNAHLYTYLGMALAASYLATVLKDLSRFKEPMNPLDMTEQEWMRIVRQSGLLSYYEPFFNAAQFGTDAAFGPAVGTATDIASLDFGDAVEPYTGQFLPLVGPVIKQAAHVAHETIFNFVGEETARATEAD
tara:strand:- start:2450 stop:7357 length:4908 start_codon:yes stop_codon:yes gene_type:complete